MLRYGLLVTCVTLSALLTGCANSAPDTHDADVSALKDTEAAWVKDAATKDVDKWGYTTQTMLRCCFRIPRSLLVRRPFARG